MELKGELTDIIYQNEVNSYTVAVLTTDEEEFTVVGYLPFIHQGDSLSLIGKFVTHQDYGRQFKIETFEKIMPQTLSSLERYLANGTIKGIGPATAKKIINKFGEQTISIFKFEPIKLAKIKGITEEKALQMAEDFNENWELWQIVGFLEKFGIGVQSAKNVYKTLGINAVEEIQANPYILIDVANHVDFKQIDKIAMDLGIEYNSEKRIKSGIKYALLRATSNGHCRILENNLYNFVQNLLGVSKEEIENALIELKVRKEIVIEKEEENLVYLDYYYQAEENVAKRLLLLDNARNIKKINNLKKEIKEIEKETKITLSDKQKEAIEAINENNVCVITGGPGTGKTTIIKAIIELYDKYGKKTVLCAPTGRAAKRMTQTTDREAMTLHRLLEIGKIEEEGKISNIDYEVAPIDADVIVIDEMSMVDIFLMNYVVKAIYQGTKLVLVGDVDQLPSVGPGSVLSDIINSGRITTITLDKIFRQAAESKIIINSHRVNRGEIFIKKDEAVENNLKEDFFYIPEIDQNKILEQVVSLCNGRLKNYGNFDFFKNIQVITPTKKGILGTKELNKILQEKLNQKVEGDIEKQSMGATFRVGDRVMQIKNNYDIFWEKRGNTYETGTGVFNGELGTIKIIDDIEKRIKILFDDEKIAWYSYQDLEQIEHAYAITVHKAQRKRI